MSGYRAGMFIINSSLRNIVRRNRYLTQHIRQYTRSFRTPSPSSSIPNMKPSYQFKGQFKNIPIYPDKKTTGTAGFSLSKVIDALKPRYRINGLLRNPTVADYRFRRRPPLYYAPAYVAPYVLCGCLTLGIACYLKYETVPYTKRTRLVGMTPSMEKRLSNLIYTIMTYWSLKGKYLPEDHPQTVRVRAITNRINVALQRGIQEKSVWSDDKNCDRDQKFVESLNWEVFVVEKDEVNAFCLPGGKIVVYTKLLERFRTDTELATVLGHEMAHAVARHGAESITKFCLLDLFVFVLHECLPVLIYSNMMSYLLELPMYRRHEIEADHIGMLLMAAAGYNPRIAPYVYKKFCQYRIPLGNYLFTHPEGERRAELLNESRAMSQALTLYEEAKARYPQEEIDESDMDTVVMDFIPFWKEVIREKVHEWIQQVKKDNDMDFVYFTEF